MTTRPADAGGMTADEPLATRTLLRGDATPLVLLPAFPLDGRMWEDVAARLSPGRTVLTVDLPGLGRSPEGEAVGVALGRGPEPSLETSADAVARTVRAAGLERAVVAGLSMGGYVAMALLERHPDLVAGLALLDTRSTPDDAAGRANRLRVADAVLAAGDVAELAGTPRALLGAETCERHPELVDRVAGWVRDQRPAGVAWSQRAMAARPDRTAVLGACRVPAVVVVGEQDRTTPVAAAEHMVEVLPDATLVLVPRAGHLTSIEDPVTVARALEGLLLRVDGAAPA